MEKDTNIIFRVNSNLKESATNVAQKYGVSLTELLTACLIEFDKRDFVPTNIRRHFPNAYTRQSEPTLAMIKSYLNEIIEKQAHGSVKKVYLFGSYARGEQTAKSNINLRFEINDSFSITDQNNIKLELTRALHRDVDIIKEDLSNLEDSFAKNIKKDEICIYERQV